MTSGAPSSQLRLEPACPNAAPMPHALRQAWGRQTIAVAIDPDEAARFAPDTYGCHEALHIAYVLAEMADERSAKHLAVKLRSFGACRHRWERITG